MFILKATGFQATANCWICQSTHDVFSIYHNDWPNWNIMGCFKGGLHMLTRFKQSSTTFRAMKTVAFSTSGRCYSKCCWEAHPRQQKKVEVTHPKTEPLKPLEPLKPIQNGAWENYFPYSWFGIFSGRSFWGCRKLGLSPLPFFVLWKVGYL